MNQRPLVRDVELLLGSLRGVYIPDADVRESDVDFLVRMTSRAAFGERAVELDFEGAARAMSMLESVVNEPTRYEVRISRRRSRVRKGATDLFVELWSGDQLVVDGTSPVLSVAVCHAMRALATL